MASNRSWLSRLFGGAAAAPPVPTPAPNMVTIPDDLVVALTRSGVDLEAAVCASLRDHIAAVAHAAEAQARGEKMPFWLQRDAGSGDIDNELRDRVTQRRASENDR